MEDGGLHVAQPPSVTVREIDSNSATPVHDKVGIKAYQPIFPHGSSESSVPGLLASTRKEVEETPTRQGIEISEMAKRDHNQQSTAQSLQVQSRPTETQTQIIKEMLERLLPEELQKIPRPIYLSERTRLEGSSQA